MKRSCSRPIDPGFRRGSEKLSRKGILSQAAVKISVNLQGCVDLKRPPPWFCHGSGPCAYSLRLIFMDRGARRAALVVSQMIDLLVNLVRNRGRVGKDAVIDGVWDGRIMSDWANREDAG